MASCAPITSRCSVGISRFDILKMVSSALFHHSSALDRVERSTMASGYSSASGRQNAHAGQSTVAA